MIAMMPWQLAQDLIRVREAELSRRARSATAHQTPASNDDDAPASRMTRTTDRRLVRKIALIMRLPS